MCLEASLGQVLTLPFHASSQALLIATVLTAVPLALVHCTVFVIATRVGQVLPNGAFEETLAALAAVNPIVLAYEGRSVAVRNLHAHLVIESLTSLPTGGGRVHSLNPSCVSPKKVRDNSVLIVQNPCTSPPVSDMHLKVPRASLL